MVRKKAGTSARSGDRLFTWHGRLLLVWLLIGTVAPIAAVRWYYLRQQHTIESAVAEQINSIADAKAAQIKNWRLERIGDGTVLTSRPVIRIAERIIRAGAASGTDKEEFLDIARKMARSFLYTAAVLVDHAGKILVEWKEGNGGSDALWRLGREAAGAGQVALTDLYRDPGTQRSVMALAVPAPRGGALMLEADASRFLFPYLDARQVWGRTTETILVRRTKDGFVYLSRLRYAPGAPSVRKRRVSEETIRNVLNTPAGGWIEGLDYRNVPIIGVLRQIPGSTWYLVTKIDQEEVYAPVRRVAWETGLAIVLIALTNAAGVGLVWRSKQLRAREEREDWLRMVSDSTPAYLWLAGPNEGNSFMNKRLKDFLGAERDQLGRQWPQFIHPDDVARAEAEYTRCIAERCEYTDEFRIRRFDGEYRPVICQGIPRFSPSGEFLGHAGAMMDITELKAAQQRLRETNTELARELQERERTDNEIQALSARLLRAQEEERTRIARELHDDLAQRIAAVSIAASNVRRDIPEEQAHARSLIARIQERLVDLSECVRRISHELHPAVLKHSGLAPALRAYCEEFTSLTRIRVSFAASGCFEAVPPGAALCLYRITQEALQNVAKHAKVGEAEVELSRSGSEVLLTVSDKGEGIDSPPNAAGGLGLVSMRERARLVNGHVRIRTAPKLGTAITVEIPIDAGA